MTEQTLIQQIYDFCNRLLSELPYALLEGFLIPILRNKVALEDLLGFVNVRGAMNCATTNACFDNEKLSFGNGITPIMVIRG